MSTQGSHGTVQPVCQSPRDPVTERSIVGVHRELNSQGSARRLEPKFDVQHACRRWKLRRVEMYFQQSRPSC